MTTLDTSGRAADADRPGKGRAARGRAVETGPITSGPTAGAPAVRFGATVRLTKQEAFDACQVLADADRFLVRAGRLAEASALGDLFELFEERLTSG
jgi:hypothetical protein